MTAGTTALALTAALGWAVADFLGARAGRKVSSLALTFYLQIFIGILLLPAAFMIGGHLSAKAALIGLGSGVFNIVGYGLLVEGMRRHRIGIVIPSSAVTSTLLAVVVGIALGDSLTLIAVIGIVASITGVAIASSHDSFNFNRGALLFGIGSGLGFGAMYIFLARTPSSAGIWPIITMRFACPTLYLYARATGASLKLDGPLLRHGVLISVVGLVALPAFTYAARIGPLSIVTAISSASPALTVIIAHLVNHEKATKAQFAGVVLATVGVATLAFV